MNIAIQNWIGLITGQTEDGLAVDRPIPGNKYF
jgi:hypothetical protein